VVLFFYCGVLFFPFFLFFWFLYFNVIFSFFSLGWGGNYFFLFSKEIRLLLFLLFLIYLIGFVCLEEIFLPFFFVVLGALYFFLRRGLLVLFITFEFCLFPVLIIILVWGRQPERLSAIYYFIIYAFFSGLPFILLLGVLLKRQSLLVLKIRSSVFFWGLLLGFMVKFPLFGFHLWLPKAHVEAPTLGSVVLAGLLLKLGRVGLCRLLFIRLSFYFFIFEFFAFVGMLAGALLCRFQRDGKSLVAYSSVCHINFILLVLVYYFKRRKLFSYLIIFSHGVSASIIFWRVGFLFHYIFRRNVFWLRGLGQVRGSFIVLIIIVFIRNFGFPFSLAFFQEVFFVFCLRSIRRVVIFLLIFYIVFVCYFSLFLLVNFRRGFGNVYFIFLKDYSLLFFSCLVLYNFFILLLVSF